MIVLASKSPRRYKLLTELIGSTFIVDAFDIDETKSYILSPIEAVKDISKRKAKESFKHHPNDTVIAADTIVVLNKKIYGKPKNKKDAQDILKALSGKTHQVITAYTIINKERILTKTVISYVTFKELSNDFIDKYIESKSPLDKAGAYGIQDNVKWDFLDKLEGSFSNVIGLPKEELKKDLNSFIL